MKVNIYVRPDTGTLTVQVSMFAQRKPVFSTGIQIDPKDWDKKKQQIKQKVTGADEVNKKLERYIKRIRDEYDRLTEKGIKPTFEDLKKIFDVKEAEPEPEGLSFLKFMEDRIAFELKKGHITKDREKHEKVSLVHLKEFAKTYPFDFDSLDNDFYKSFVAYMADKGMLNNSIGTIISHLKKHCEIAVEKELLKNLKFKKFKVLKEKFKKITYKEPDILRVYKYDFTGCLDATEIRKAVDLNTFRFYAGGIRHGDTQLINKGNVIDVELEDGTKCKGLKYSQGKTDAPNVILLNDICLEILERNNYILPRFATSSVCNKYMKAAFRIAGFKNIIIEIRHSGKKRIETQYEAWELLGRSHSTRYSSCKFILKKSNGNIYLAQVSLGHQDPRTTQSYADSEDGYSHEEFYKVIK